MSEIVLDIDGKFYDIDTDECIGFTQQFKLIKQDEEYTYNNLKNMIDDLVTNQKSRSLKLINTQRITKIKCKGQYFIKLVNETDQIIYILDKFFFKNLKAKCGCYFGFIEIVYKFQSPTYNGYIGDAYGIA